MKRVKAFRGGSWLHVTYYCRSECRLRSVPSHHNGDLGFRLTAQISMKKRKVIRGGSWYVDTGVCRSAYRDWDELCSPDSPNSDLGFRLVCFKEKRHETG